MQAMVPEYGKVWYDDKSISNIFSFANLVNKFRVNYDSNLDDTFTVHTNIGIMKLRRNEQGFYVFKPTYITTISDFVTTVEDNMVVLKIRQIYSSKLSGKILPTVKNFIHMLSINMISN